MRSYFGRYWATTEKTLIGDVEAGATCRYDTSCMAEARLHQVLECNNKDGRPCEGELLGSREDPQILHHPCRPGGVWAYLATAVGCRCPQCGRRVTEADAMRAGDRCAKWS